MKMYTAVLIVAAVVVVSSLTGCAAGMSAIELAAGVARGAAPADNSETAVRDRIAAQERAKKIEDRRLVAAQARGDRNGDGVVSADELAYEQSKWDESVETGRRTTVAYSCNDPQSGARALVCAGDAVGLDVEVWH